MAFSDEIIRRAMGQKNIAVYRTCVIIPYSTAIMNLARMPEKTGSFGTKPLEAQRG